MPRIHKIISDFEPGRILGNLFYPGVQESKTQQESGGGGTSNIKELVTPQISSVAAVGASSNIPPKPVILIVYSNQDIRTAIVKLIKLGLLNSKDYKLIQTENTKQAKEYLETSSSGISMIIVASNIDTFRVPDEMPDGFKFVEEIANEFFLKKGLVRKPLLLIDNDPYPYPYPCGITNHPQLPKDFVDRVVIRDNLIEDLVPAVEHLLQGQKN